MTRPPPLDAIPRHVVALRDYEPLARERLDDNAWTYLASGAGDELTLRWNRQAFDDTRLMPRTMRSFAGGSLESELLGMRLAHPIVLGPVAYQKLFHPEGECATAQAAAALHTPLVVATLSSVDLEAVSTAAPDASRWFQLYVQPERDLTLDLVRRAEGAGYSALVVTVDAPLNGLRNAEQRIGFRLPENVFAANLPLRGARPPSGGHPIFDDLLAGSPVWRDLEWLRAATRLPLIVKGILNPDDARQARACGADALVVSNHGGRTLDTLEASLHALPAVRQAVGAQFPLLLDGGIWRGTDVLKALALGANAVMLGRAYAMALAAAGPLGVAHAIRILVEEFTVAMALTGCATIADITPALISRGR
jgi:4-hydroxymandelate oxidase